MFYRWLIRSSFLTVLLLLSSMWILSYRRYFEINTPIGACDIDKGFMVLGERYQGQGWFIDSQSTVGWQFDTMGGEYVTSPGHFLGFAFDPLWDEVRSFMILPMWYPTAISALILLFAWRRTRRRKLLKAFPVEVTAQPVSSKSN